MTMEALFYKNLKEAHDSNAKKNLIQIMSSAFGNTDTCFNV